MEKFIVFYDDSIHFNIYDGTNYFKRFNSDKIYNKKTDPKYYKKNFEVIKSFYEDNKDLSDELLLIKYHEQLIKECNISISMFNINFLLYKYNNHACMHLFFNSFCGNDMKPKDYLKNSDNIDIVEFNWIEKCNNNGYIYFNDSYKDKTIQTYTYDYNSLYPTILTFENLFISYKKGEEIYIPTPKYKSFYRNLEHGYYKMNIINNDSIPIENFFTISKNNIYTNTDIKYLYELRNTYKININFEIIDENPNAYIYDKKDLLTGKHLFDNYIYKLKTLKNCGQKLYFINYLLKALWGGLSQKNVKIFNINNLKNSDKYTFYDYPTRGFNDITMIKNKKNF